MDFSFHASCMCIPFPHPELGSVFPHLGCNLTAQYNGWEWHPGTSETWFLEALHLSPRLIGALTLEKVRGPATLRPPYGEKHKPRGQTQDMPRGEKETTENWGTRHLNEEVILELCPPVPDAQLSVPWVRDKPLSQDLPEFWPTCHKQIK